MAIKFNEYWNVIPDKTDEYIDFMQRSRLPTLNRLGINIVAMWSTLIGAGPQIISVGVSENLDKWERALKTSEYNKITTQLLHFVTNYHSKVMMSSGRYPHLPRGTEKGPVKLSQYWDVIPGQEEAYEQYIKGTFYNGLEELGINVIGEWKVLIGESPNIFYEARSDSETGLLRALMSQKFRILKNDLLNLVTNYSSRVLVYHAFKSKKVGARDYEFFVV